MGNETEPNALVGILINYFCPFSFQTMTADDVVCTRVYVREWTTAALLFVSPPTPPVICPSSLSPSNPMGFVLTAGKSHLFLKSNLYLWPSTLSRLRVIRRVCSDIVEPPASLLSYNVTTQEWVTLSYFVVGRRCSVKTSVLRAHKMLQGKPLWACRSAWDPDTVELCAVRDTISSVSETHL